MVRVKAIIGVVKQGGADSNPWILILTGKIDKSNNRSKSAIVSIGDPDVPTLSPILPPFILDQPTFCGIVVAN